MINNVVLTGRLTKDIELRYTPNGKAVANGTIAVARSFSNANGEKEADFLLIQAWGKTAETMANYLKKGNLIGVEGRLASRDYEQDGVKKYITEIIIEKFTFLEKKNN